jgi:hypothetical protein
MADIVRFKDVFQNPNALSFKDMYVVEYKPGEDELVNYRAMRRKRTIGVGEGGYVGESVNPDAQLPCNNPGCDCDPCTCGPNCSCGNIIKEEIDEALTMAQRQKRARIMKRLKSRIKLGRERQKRKMADKGRLEKRAIKQAKNRVIKKILKGKQKRDLSFARRQEIEKRLEKPAFKARIQRLAKRMFPQIRRAEVQRKKG